MDDLKPKWIIQDGMLRLGRVMNHFELAAMDGGDILGGGLWEFDRDNKELYLYGKSYDYGQVCEDDFKDIWVQPALEDATIFFSTYMTLEHAKKSNILIR